MLLGAQVFNVKVIDPPANEIIFYLQLIAFGICFIAGLGVVRLMLLGKNSKWWW